MGELRHECGVAAIYHLPDRGESALCPPEGPDEVSRLIPRMLLDIQNRGQLSAGMTTYDPKRRQLIDTYKDLGTVSEVFRLNHLGKYESLMQTYAGRAAIGHVRYATCGAEDRSYAQPFERHHIQKHKWFSFGFNGQLANYMELREALLGEEGLLPCARERHRNHHAPDLSRAFGRFAADASGSLPPGRRPTRRRIFFGAAQRVGRDAGGSRSAGESSLCAMRWRVRYSRRPARASPC